MFLRRERTRWCVVALILGGLLLPLDSVMASASPVRGAPVAHIVRPSAIQYTEKLVKRHGVIHGTLEIGAGFRLNGPTQGVVTPRPVPANSAKQCQPDSSDSFQLCLTQNFLVYTPKPPEYPAVKVTSYVAKWTRLDKSQLLQVSSASILMGHAGNCELNCKNDAEVQTATHKIGTPKMGSNYSATPPWKGYYEVNNVGLGWQCGRASSTVTRYSAHWTLAFDVCQGALDGGFG